LGDLLFREHGRQVAALCWRGEPPQVLLITSLNTKRWILPKGWPIDGMTLAQSAAREAFEEAGLQGVISTEPIGNYPYLKEKKDGGAMACSVDVFAMEVTSQAADWLEKGARELAWLPPDQAAAKVAEPGLRQILLDYAASWTPRARRAG
jgi:8-oxo-dGTP pyrophosphatase MutT (NUDIX family)